MSHRAKRTAGWSAALVACMLFAVRFVPIAARQFQTDRGRAATDVAGATTTRLDDGRWLVVGGEGAEQRALVYDALGRTAQPTATPLGTPRAWHTATVLPDGTVLIAGGRSGNGIAEIPELFVPATNTFSPVPMPGAAPRAAHSATLLTDGRVLVVGGTAGAPGAIATEIWDIAAQTVTPIPAASLGRAGHTATLMGDGRVLLADGRDLDGKPVDDTLALDPEAGAMSPVEPPQKRGVPMVTRTVPEAGASDVAIDAHVTVRFSDPINVMSLTPDTLVLAGPDGAVATRLIPAEDGRLVFLWPVDRLSENTTYTLIVSGPVDRAGVPVTPASIVFTTKRLGDAPTAPSNDDWTPNASWRTNRAPSPWQQLPPLMAPPGVTALSGQVLKLNGEPLADVLLQVDKHVAHTDRTGRFLVRLDGMSTQHVELWIDSRPASRPTATYGSYEVGVDVQGGRTTVLPYTIWLTKLDTAHAVTIPSPTPVETVVTTPAIPGLELRLPTGTVIRDHDGKTVTRLTITPIPLDRPPFPLPGGVRVPVYFTIQPGGGYIYVSGAAGRRGARLIYPNGFHLPSGFVFEFWHYNPDGPGWTVYGQGKVTPDARQVAPNAGVEIYEFTGAMAGPPGLAPGSGPPPDGNKGGDPVDLFTGLFVLQKTDLALPDVIPIALTRTYRPADTRSRAFGIGTTHPYDIFLVGDTFPYTFLDLILPDGGRVHFNRTSPGTDFSDAVYAHTATPTEWYGSGIVWNGAGWTLTKKDGTVLKFQDGAFATKPQQCAATSIHDRYGNVLTLTRDANKNLTQVHSPNGRFLNFTYDPSDRITQVQDNIGRTVGYTYDMSGRLFHVTDPEGGVTEYTYDSAHRLQTVKDPRGNIYLMNQYDGSDRVIKQVQADGGTYQFAYTVDGQGRNVTSVTNPRGYVTQTTFNAAGYPVLQVEAVGTTVERTTTTTRESGTNLVTSIVDGLNRRTDYTYDTGHVRTITRLVGTQDAVTTTFTYEPLFFQVATVKDPLQHTWTTTYDAQGRPTGTTDPLNHSTTIVLNGAGQVASVTDALSHQGQTGYTDGVVTSVTNALNQTTSRFVDGAGRIIAMMDALGRTTKMTLDKLDRVSSVLDPAGGQTQFAYDPNSNLLSLTDASTHATSYTYDASDRVATRTDPLHAVASYQYDRGNNLTQVADRNGQVTQYQYDPLDRLSQVTYVDGSTTAYTYDLGDRPTLVVETIGQTSTSITRGYDGLDRLTSETTPAGNVTYTYDSDGRRATMTVAGQPQVTYAYDDAHRLTSITQGTGVVAFTFDNADRQSTVTYPNGIVATYGYDDANQLTSLTYTQGQNTLGTLTYTYDAAGNRISVGGSWARTGLPQPIASATYDAANRIQAWAGKTFSYDNNGNLGSDGLTSYTWNARNQLASMSGTTSASFAYDATGRRLGKTVNGATTNFLHDGVNLVQELSGSATANLLTGGIDETFTRTDASGTSTLLNDALRSTLALADTSGVAQTQYTLDPFGAATVSGASSTNAAQFTGRENDSTGLYYYRARYYAPATGRFVSEDPMGFAGGIDFYTYAGNNPVNLVDPLGLLQQRAPLPGPIPLPEPGPALPWWLWWIILMQQGDGRPNQTPSPDLLDWHRDQAKKKCNDPGCKPCVPPVGTIAYRLDTEGRPHAGVRTPHWRLYVMQQSPAPVCKCEWVDIRENQGGLGGGNPPPSTVPIGPAGGGGPK